MTLDSRAPRGCVLWRWIFLHDCWGKCFGTKGLSHFFLEEKNLMTQKVLFWVSDESQLMDTRYWANSWPCKCQLFDKGLFSSQPCMFTRVVVVYTFQLPPVGMVKCPLKKREFCLSFLFFSEREERELKQGKTPSSHFQPKTYLFAWGFWESLTYDDLYWGLGIVYD